MSPSKKWNLCQVASEHKETLEQRLQLTNYVHPPPTPNSQLFQSPRWGKILTMEILNKRFVYFFLVFVFSQNNLKYIFGIWGCSNIFEALVFFFN
jgi:hypothetical protein